MVIAWAPVIVSSCLKFGDGLAHALGHGQEGEQERLAQQAERHERLVHLGDRAGDDLGPVLLGPGASPG